MPHASDIQRTGPAAMAATLVTTLEAERESLTRLCGCFEAQLEALRTRAQDRMQEVTIEANEEVANLSRLRQTRERQTRLLGRMLQLDADNATLTELADTLVRLADGDDIGHHLLDVRTRVRAKAQETHERCQELEFALQYAVQLGREMMQAMQGLDTAPPTRVYTATGSAARTTSTRSLLNHVG